MLNPELADVADALSRVCIMRTEDHQLLKEIRRTRRRRNQQRPQHEDSAAARADDDDVDERYFRHVVSEFGRREVWRQQREEALLVRLRAWERSYCAPSSSGAAAPAVREAAAWAQMGPLKTVYCECIQLTYSLKPHDLVCSPMAHPDFGPSCHLYSTTGSQRPYSRRARVAGAHWEDDDGAQEMPNMTAVHQALFPAKRSSGTDAALRQAEELLDTLFPLSETPLETGEKGEDFEGGALHSTHRVAVPLRMSGQPQLPLKPATRVALRASRHAWQVLFLLWKHCIMHMALEDGARNFGCAQFAASVAARHFLRQQQGLFAKVLLSLDEASAAPSEGVI